jgi:thioredoxin
MRIAAFGAILGFATFLALSLSANAVQPFDPNARPYSDQAFHASQAAGDTILVHVTAVWCPTCKAQRPIVESIQKERPKLVIYDVDFDTAKDVLRQFRVQSQSTLIVFKGTKEVARSVGETDPARVRALIAQGF